MNEEAQKAGVPALPPDAAAFLEVEPELAALPRHELRPVNVDVTRVAILVHGAVQRLRPLLPALRANLPNLPLYRIERLETYARAAAYAHVFASVPASSRAREAVLALAEEGESLRQRLAAYVELLRLHGVAIERPHVRRGRRSRGRLAAALIWLSETLKKHLGVIPLPCTRADLAKADQLAAAIVQAEGERTVGAAHDQRVQREQLQRAFTLLADVYDEAYSAVDYLRRKQGGARAILPSLCHQPGRRRRRPDALVEEDAPDSPALDP
jgi:hypothetical protein